MQALLLIAHGSRLNASNNEVNELVQSLKPQLNSKFDLVKAAFLELCEPSIGSAIDEIIDSGGKNIVVLPYFLNQGRHVSEDVPGEIALKQSQYPNIIITTLPYFGRSEEIVGLLAKLVNRTE